MQRTGFRVAIVGIVLWAFLGVVEQVSRAFFTVRSVGALGADLSPAGRAAIEGGLIFVIVGILELIQRTRGAQSARTAVTLGLQLCVLALPAQFFASPPDGNRLIRLAALAIGIVASSFALFRWRVQRVR